MSTCAELASQLSEAQAAVELKQAEYNVALANKNAATELFDNAQTALGSANMLKAYLQMAYTNQGC